MRRTVERIEKLRDELRDAILEASESGESIRDIAQVAGLSPSRVHELLREARKRRERTDPND